MAQQQEEHQVVLRDLEPLLLPILGPQVRLLGFECEALVKTGDNYGSTIRRVKTKIKRADADEEEELSLVAKMLPTTDYMRMIFESQFTFKKEIFLYEDLIPTYRSLLPGGDFDVTPRFYGARLSKTPGAEQIDDDAVILLENLACKGYYMVDRHKGLNAEQMKAALAALAKFHAIGLSVKYKKPSYLPSLRKYGKPMAINDEVMGGILEAALQDLSKDPFTGPRVPAIRATQDALLSKTYYSPLEPEHEWACLVHGDFWINNMLLSEEQAKILDFQTFYIASPLSDLVFFLCTSMERNLEGFDETLESYRQQMVELLGTLGCDPELLSERRFNERIKIDARNELVHIILMCKVVELNEDEELDNCPANEACMRRIRRILEIYTEKKWL